MTVAEAVTSLLTLFHPDERTVPDAAAFPGRNAEILHHLNGGFQEFLAKGPAAGRRRDATILLRAPTTITISLTADSTAGTILAADWQSWMDGCTVHIAGATAENRILTSTDNAGDRDVTLYRAHEGSTGSISAEVRHDSISLASTVLGVLKPVGIAHGSPLAPASSRMALRGQRTDSDYGRHKYGTTFTSRSYAPGTPAAYFIDEYLPATGNPAFRMIIAPAPYRNMWLEWREKVGPPRFTDATSTDAIPIQHDFAESILIPFAKQRLTASQFFAGGDVAVREIGRQYQEALKLARSSKVQKSPGVHLLATYNA